MKCKVGWIKLNKWDWPDCIEDKCYFWNNRKCKLI